MKLIKFAVVFSVGLSFAGPIENLKASEWYEVPNSTLDAVKPNPLPPSYFGGLIVAWNSGAYDTKRDRFLVWGGGHCDYAGNEIYAFDVNTLQWSRIWGPTPNQNIGPCGTSSEAYSDGNPSARHIYDGLEYLPDPVDALMIVGGALWGGIGGGGAWLYKFASGTWEQKVTQSDNRNGDESAYDPTTGHVFMRGNYWVSEFNPQANTWTKRNSQSPAGGGWWGDDGVAAIDYKRGLMVFNGMWGIYNLKTNQFSYPATTGDNAIQSSTVSGIDYDPVSDRMVAWSGGANVYSLNLDTYQWTRHLPASTNTVTPPQPPSAGTFGRFRYIPSKNAFICVSGVTQNVFIYKLTAGTGVEMKGEGKRVKDELIVSPNPVRSGANLRIAGAGASTSFDIYDLSGKRIAHLAATVGNQAVWKTGKVSAGIYVVKTYSGIGTHSAKLLIQK